MTSFLSPLNPDHPLHTCAAALTARFNDVGFTSAGILAHLGPEYLDALYRGEPAGALLSTDSGLPLDVLVRAFLLHQPVPERELAGALGSQLCTRLRSAGAVISASEHGYAESDVLVALDIRPHVINGQHTWVFSDVDASVVPHVPGPEHVLGVGAASLSLLHSTPTSPVDSVLDLGTGSGVQILGQLGCANSITGTDVHGRALDFARATVTAAGAEDKVELLHGSWFEPVAGRTFDRVVANPPFVVGLPEVGHVYRDSGLNLDDASALVVSSVTDFLNPGGSAHLLAAWVHKAEQPWEHRVASWLPDKGVCAWVVQRDVADPALYVSTWLKDESVDVRTPEGLAKAQLWLKHFADNDVHGIGFGFVAIKRIDDDAPSDVLAEYMPQAFTDPLGSEVEEYFARMDWLRNTTREGIACSRFALRPGLARENIEQHHEGTPGFSPAALRLTRTEGPRWSHDVDSHLSSVVAGLDPHGLNLEETVGLYAAVHGFDEDQLLESAVDAVIDLLRHGLVIPAEMVEG